MTNSDLRNLALANIQAAERVIRYNQQFLYPSDITDDAKRLANIEKAIQGNIVDANEIIERLKSQLMKNRDDIYRHRDAAELHDWEEKKIAYEHCLRIIRGEQNI